MTDVDLAAALQACISPMILISGVGLLLMTLANRLTHAIARVRQLDGELETDGGDGRADKVRQLRLIYRRCRILQASIGCVVVSILCSSVIILCLFGVQFFDVDLGRLVPPLFGASLLAIIAAGVLLLIDVSGHLAAVRLEVREHLES